MMNASISKALSERGYVTLTAVQEAVTAPELEQADLLVSAQTGSGKTVGFGLAIARTLLGEADALGPAASPLALVIAPTRELALQVMRELGWLYAHTGARVVSCVGGMDMRDERRALERGAHIVVGTPGRLRDHIQRGSLDMTDLRAVILDEADEMLDLGFREDLEFMLGAAPSERRTLMFSATVPPMIATLAKHYQRDAVRVTTLSGAGQHADIAYQALRVAQSDGENAIINVLRFHDAQNAIVFANTRAAVNRLAARFSNRGFSVVSLSGELSQSERTHALQAMRDGRARVCVATDVAARGIDLPNLELVIHADLPSNPDGLLHRSGRTGRAGRKGTSALIVTPKIVKKAERLLKFAKIEAEWKTAPSADDVIRRDEERLLSDPVWEEEANEEQSAFADKLLGLHSPEKIAVAYLRLYRARQSAPEDLDAPDAPPPSKDRKPFGPSFWFSLSVGRDDRAEPRWLLPLLCRAGDLNKDAIGAIKVQQSETFVELTQASAAKFMAGVGENGELEKGVKVRQLDGPPDRGSRAETPSRAKPGKRPDRDQRSEKPVTAEPVSALPVSPERESSAVQEPEAKIDIEGAVHPYKARKKDDFQKRKGPKTGKPSTAGKRPGDQRAKPAFVKPERSDLKPRASKGPIKIANNPGGDTGKPKPNASDPSKRVTWRGKDGKPNAGATKSSKRKAPTTTGREPPRRKS
jgi:ATP-dependent RNA helicase DeaD